MKNIQHRTVFQTLVRKQTLHWLNYKNTRGVTTPCQTPPSDGTPDSNTTSHLEFMSYIKLRLR